LQLACMTSVIANGGELMQPYLIQSILQNDGSVAHTTQPKVIRRVISQETSATLRLILEKVVSHGNGSMAAVEGVTVAGKTGTAEQSTEGFIGYTPGIHVSSFVGFWPADIPKYVLVVVLDEPREQYWASKSAAPIFSRMVDRIIALPENPRYFEVESAQKSTNKVFAFAAMPLPFRQKSSNEKKKVPDLAKRSVSQFHVPNLVNMSLREALKLCGDHGIAVEADGSGRVISQDPKSGTRIHPGLVCRIKCEQGKW
jgi:membrane peptidoglycan carboxypeptidase